MTEGMAGEELDDETMERLREIARQEARNEDTVLSDQIAGLESSVARWMERTDGWIEQVQGWMDESRQDRQQLRDLIEANTAQQARLIDFLFGEPATDIDGHLVRRDGGFKATMEQAVRELNANGGFKIKVPWVRLTAALTAAGGLIAALIQLINAA